METDLERCGDLPKATWVGICHFSQLPTEYFPKWGIPEIAWRQGLPAPWKGNFRRPDHPYLSPGRWGPGSSPMEITPVLLPCG